MLLSGIIPIYIHVDDVCVFFALINELWVFIHGGIDNYHILCASFGFLYSLRGG